MDATNHATCPGITRKRSKDTGNDVRLGYVGVGPRKGKGIVKACKRAGGFLCSLNNDAEQVLANVNKVHTSALGYVMAA